MGGRRDFADASTVALRDWVLFERGAADLGLEPPTPAVDTALRVAPVAEVVRPYNSTPTPN